MCGRQSRALVTPVLPLVRRGMFRLPGAIVREGGLPLGWGVLYVGQYAKVTTPYARTHARTRKAGKGAGNTGP